MPIHGLEPGAKFRHTTILSVRHGGHVVMAGDGQVSVGQTIMKCLNRDPDWVAYRQKSADAGNVQHQECKIIKSTKFSPM